MIKLDYEKIENLLNEYYSNITFTRENINKRNASTEITHKLSEISRRNMEIEKVFKLLSPITTVYAPAYLDLIMDTLGGDCTIYTTQYVGKDYSTINLSYNGKNYFVGYFNPAIFNTELRGTNCEKRTFTFKNTKEDRQSLYKVFSTDHIHVTSFANRRGFLFSPYFNRTPINCILKNSEQMSNFEKMSANPFTAEQLVEFKSRLADLMYASASEYIARIKNASKMVYLNNSKKYEERINALKESGLTDEANKMQLVAGQKLDEAKQLAESYENDETQIFLNRFKDTNNYSLQHTIINELTSSNSNEYNLTSTQKE